MERAETLERNFPVTARAEPLPRHVAHGNRAWKHWEVARWGRLLAGLGTLLFTALGLWLHPYWLAGTLAMAANLVVTAITDRCAMRDLLLRMGAKEREELFLPGGKLRAEHSLPGSRSIEKSA